MAKAYQPLHSFRAKGTFGDVVIFRDFPHGYQRQTRVNVKQFQKKPTGRQQIKKEAAMRAAQSIWASLSAAEKSLWELVAFDRHAPYGERAWRADLSAYHKFMSYAVRAYLRGDEIPHVPDEL